MISIQGKLFDARVSKADAFIILFVITILLFTQGCHMNRNVKVENAIEDFIEHEKSVPVKRVPIAIVYLGRCSDPSPPTDNNMLAYEIALRDAVVSYKECRDSKDALIEQVISRRDKPLSEQSKQQVKIREGD